ncbi:hypothetical protein FB45DRAFT_870268 [Roridomyces roridus]|uniref:Uncharacterized protein n=1 Tax=Roridomyces roridus TaxID=1738132 RepID=A0AAD7BIF3_9AGAR|nr:hypothetical protein FB45DRAFT_870268 [Roridomyces roridus]
MDMRESLFPDGKVKLDGNDAGEVDCCAEYWLERETRRKYEYVYAFLNNLQLDLGGQFCGMRCGSMGDMPIEDSIDMSYIDASAGRIQVSRARQESEARKHGLGGGLEKSLSGDRGRYRAVEPAVAREGHPTIGQEEGVEASERTLASFVTSENCAQGPTLLLAHRFTLNLAVVPDHFRRSYTIGSTPKDKKTAVGAKQTW